MNVIRKSEKGFSDVKVTFNETPEYSKRESFSVCYVDFLLLKSDCFRYRQLYSSVYLQLMPCHLSRLGQCHASRPDMHGYLLHTYTSKLGWRIVETRGGAFSFISKRSEEFLLFLS